MGDEAIIRFDPALGTHNSGDYIIQNAIDFEMKYLFNRYYCISYSTHDPKLRFAQRCFFKRSTRDLDNIKYKFLCGTNLFQYSLARLYLNWNISFLDLPVYSDSISLGCGSSLNRSTIDTYTKNIYKKILSKECIHSTRDDRTANLLVDLGFNAINTGCPTTWSLSQEKVDAAYRDTSIDAVLYTITDYAKNIERDSAIFELLAHRYKIVYFWPQGIGDIQYLHELGIADRVKIIGMNYHAYCDIMDKKFDFVGTRLHGGIFALAHGHRALIISVDNRASDMISLGLPILQVDSAELLGEALDDFKAPVLKIHQDEINKWKSQFK